MGSGGFSGLTGPIPRDLLILFGILFVTFSLSFFDATSPLIGLLLLSEDAIRRGFVWQLATYPFVGIGGLFFLVTLIFLYMIARNVFYGLGRRHFWRLVFAAAIGSALVALGVDLLMGLANIPAVNAFRLMQGQSLFWSLFIAAFATANRGGTIYLIFLPIEARWFLALEALMIFIGFLFTKDLPGLFGMFTALGVGVGYVRSGGRGIKLREVRLRLERRWIQWKLDRNKRRRGFRVIPGQGERGGNGGNGEVRKGPWVH
jgi:hypothetical protein